MGDERVQLPAQAGELKEEVIAFLLNTKAAGMDTPRKILDYRILGETIWTLEEIAGRTVVLEYTLSNRVINNTRGGQVRNETHWSFEVRSEGNGPRTVSCPLEFLDRAVSFNAEWREAVRRFHGRAEVFKGLDVWKAPS